MKHPERHGDAGIQRSRSAAYRDPQAFVGPLPDKVGNPLPFGSDNQDAPSGRRCFPKRPFSVHVENRHPISFVLQVPHARSHVPDGDHGNPQYRSGACLYRYPSGKRGSSFREKNAARSGGFRSAYDRAEIMRVLNMVGEHKERRTLSLLFAKKRLKGTAGDRRHPGGNALRRGCFAFALQSRRFDHVNRNARSRCKRLIKGRLGRRESRRKKNPQSHGRGLFQKIPDRLSSPAEVRSVFVLALFLVFAFFRVHLRSPQFVRSFSYCRRYKAVYPFPD